MTHMAYGLDGALIGYIGSGFFVTVLYYPFFWINLAMTVSLHTAARHERKRARAQSIHVAAPVSAWTDRYNAVPGRPLMTPERGTVLHFIDTTGPGGAETVFLQLAAGLRDHGWAPRTVLTGPGWVLDSVRELRLPVDVVETRGRFDLSYIRALRRLVREHQVKLIHAHLFSPAVYASLVGALSGVPVVATFHGASDAVSGSFGRRLRYRLIDRKAHVVCVSEPLRDTLQSLAPIRPERLRVIPNGVDVAAFSAGDGRRHPAGAWHPR